jgi:hypothetical protein
MAWIKMQSDLESNHHVVSISHQLGILPSEVVTHLYRFASWFLRHAKYGWINGHPKIVNRLLETVGFAELLVEIGWIARRGDEFTICGFAYPTMRKSLGRRLRRRILKDAACAACGSTTDLTIDHKTPISRGGGSSEDNLQALCGACNRSKGKMTMPEFIRERNRNAQG